MRRREDPKEGSNHSHLLQLPLSRPLGSATSPRVGHHTLTTMLEGQPSPLGTLRHPPTMSGPLKLHSEHQLHRECHREGGALPALSSSALECHKSLPSLRGPSYQVDSCPVPGCCVSPCLRDLR